MNGVIMLRIPLSAEYRPLADRRLVASVDVSAPPTNSGLAYFLGTDGQDVPWNAGEWHSLTRVDLSQIRAKGSPGDILTVVGGTW